MAELEAKRERVKQNVALLKKEEEEKRLADAAHRPSRTIGKGTSPDLKSFIKQFPGAADIRRRGNEKVSVTVDDELIEERFSEPTGSGLSFKPGTWQPPT